MEVLVMAKIISLVNQKGGVGKTTTSINLSAALGKMGKRVLLIDMDPQSNATTGLGLNSNDFKNDIYELITGKCEVKKAIKKTKFHNLSIIPSTINLAGVDVEFVKRMLEDKEFSQNMQLKLRLDEIRDNYDYIIIDCQPSLGLGTMNALVASDSVIIPVQCEFFALDVLSQLIYTINLIKKKLNKSLEIEGVVFTMYDARTNLSLEVVENVKNNLDQFIYKTIIPRNVRLAEAPSFGLPINLYDSRSSGAQGYRDLADEVINNKLYAKL